MKFGFLLLGFLLLFVYVAWRVMRLVPGGMWPRLSVLLLLLGLTACFFLSFFLRNHAEPNTVLFLSRVGSSWIMMFCYLFLALALLHVLEAFFSSYLSSIPPLLKLGIIVLILGNLFIYGHYRYNDKQRTELHLTVQGNVPHADTLTFVAVSDLHLGYNIGREEFEQWIPLLNAEKPDAIFFLGDLIDNDVRPLHEGNLAASFRKLQAKYGLYAVLGNHEYIANVDRSLQFLREAGVTVLRDSVVNVDNRFTVVGRDDRSNLRRQSLPSVMNADTMALPAILLDHQPFGLEEAEQAGVDLQLSGHTHHGQVWPFSLITQLIYEQAYGYLRKGDTHYYVSSGIGLWGGKFRIGTASEYVVIRLHVQPLASKNAM